MNPELRNTILRAQRETRQAEGRQTPEDKTIKRQFDVLEEMKNFVGWRIRLATSGAIKPVTKWTGSAAVAHFTLDGQAFTILKDKSEFVLLAGDEHGTEIARAAGKTELESCGKTPARSHCEGYGLQPVRLTPAKLEGL